MKFCCWSNHFFFNHCLSFVQNWHPSRWEAKGYSAEDEAVAILYLWFTVCKPHTDISNVTCTFCKEITINVRIDVLTLGIAEDSGLLGYNTRLLGEWFPVFQRTVVPRISDWLNLVGDDDTLLWNDGNHLPDTVSGLNLQVTIEFWRVEHSTCCMP